MHSNAKALSSLHPDAAGFTLAGENQAVLCLHGFTATPQTFSELARLIHQQTSFHVHAPLLPGHGGHFQDLDQIKYQDWIDFADQQFQILQQTFDRIHLVGLSMGGTLCQILAQRYPNFTASIAMMAPALRLASTWEQSLMHFIQHLPQGMFRLITRHKQNTTPQHISYHQFSIASAVQAFALFRFCEQNLRNLNTPCLIQAPTDDRVINPISAKILSKYYEQAELHFYSNTKHVMVCSEKKDEIFARITSLIQMAT